MATVSVEPLEITAPHNMIRLHSETHTWRALSALQKELESIESKQPNAEALRSLLKLRHEINWRVGNADAQLRQSVGSRHGREALYSNVQIVEWLAERADAEVFRFQQFALREHVAGRDSTMVEFSQALFEHAKELSKRAYR